MSGPRTGGQAVVGGLEAAGIELAFTVPGESFLGLLDALVDSPIRTIATRHEGGAAFMAEACGQLTGRPQACLATRAPGAANLAIGLHTARQDSTPLIAIVGQVPRAFRGWEAFQEVDLVATFGGLCKRAAEADDPEDLEALTRELLRVATDGRPGPVLLAVPEDVLDAPVSRPPDPEPWSPGDRPSPPEPAVVESVVSALANAQRPLIVAGAGVLRDDAVDRLVRFAEAVLVPVVTAWRRPDAFPNDHPLYLGMCGLGSPPSVRERFAAADVVLALGTRLSEVTSFGYGLPSSGTRLIQVDLEPGFSGARQQPHVPVAASVGGFLDEAVRQPMPDVGPETVGAREQAIAADRQRYLAETEPPVREPSAPVHPAAVVRALKELLPAEAIITTDAGNFGGWIARYLRFRPPGRFLGPTSGAMGYGLPAAIGAALVAPDHPVVAVAGDGGFAMLMAELETAVRLGVRLVALVLDNGMYGTIRMHQELAHPGRTIATDLGPVDFAQVARACGARGVRVERDDEVADAIGEALARDGVSVVQVMIDRRYLSVDRIL